MLDNIDLSRKVGKAEYKQAKEQAELRLGALQRRAKELNIPILIVFEGWDAAGKGTLINELILPLDPRGFNVHSTLPPNEEEAMRPFLWRSWTRIPARGRLAIFDRSWYRRVLNDRVDGKVKGRQVQQAFEDIRSFERQLADDGYVIIKFFLHISKGEQKRRFAKLRRNRATAWRVSKDDVRRHRQYSQYLEAIEDMMVQTDSDVATWTVVEAHDQRFAALKIFTTVIAAVEARVAAAEARLAAREASSNRKGAAKRQAKRSDPKPAALPEALTASILDNVDLSLTLGREEYAGKLKKFQHRLRELEHEIYVRRVPVVIACEGWDAAGKGGNIRRLTQYLDPRGYEVVPIGAPNDLEKAHHYLWRFWTQMPKAGHITIFDRSWYGRVLVERVEGFCSPEEWKRAYHEINEMEQHLTHFGGVLLIFWIQIDADEQLRRFRQRQQDPNKQWKITDEDWRNREKMEAYKAAVEEMLFRTSTPYAPWTIVESNCKWYARVKTLETVCGAIEGRLG